MVSHHHALQHLWVNLVTSAPFPFPPFLLPHAVIFLFFFGGGGVGWGGAGNVLTLKTQAAQQHQATTQTFEAMQSRLSKQRKCFHIHTGNVTSVTGKVRALLWLAATLPHSVCPVLQHLAGVWPPFYSHSPRHVEKHASSDINKYKEETFWEIIGFGLLISLFSVICGSHSSQLNSQSWKHALKKNKELCFFYFALINMKQ